MSEKLAEIAQTRSSGVTGYGLHPRDSPVWPAADLRGDKLFELREDLFLIRHDGMQRGLILQNGCLIFLDRFLIGLDAALIGEDRFLILQNLFLIADHVGFGHWQVSFGRAVGQLTSPSEPGKW